MRQIVIVTERRQYADEPLGGDLASTVYALDSSTIDLCLSVFPWSRAVHAGHGGIKLHTLLVILGAILTVLHVTPAQQRDVHLLDRLVAATGAIYLMDRALLAFVRLSPLTCVGEFFVTLSTTELPTPPRSHKSDPDRAV